LQTCRTGCLALPAAFCQVQPSATLSPHISIRKDTLSVFNARLSKPFDASRVSGQGAHVRSPGTEIKLRFVTLHHLACVTVFDNNFCSVTFTLLLLFPFLFPTPMITCRTMLRTVSNLSLRFLIRRFPTYATALSAF
jgi:hypothetical protein